MKSVIALTLTCALVFCAAASMAEEPGTVTVQEWLDAKGECGDCVLELEIKQVYNPVLAVGADETGTVNLFSGNGEDSAIVWFMGEDAVIEGDILVIANPRYNVFEDSVEMADWTVVQHIPGPGHNASPAEKMISLISKAYTLTERENGELSDFEANGTAFHAVSYDAEGFGFISVMTARDPAGNAVMETVIVNPFEKDVPMLSFDGIYMGENNTFMMELYDTTLEHAFNTEPVTAAVPEQAAAEGTEETYWYDDWLLFQWTGAEEAPVLSALTAYFGETLEMPACDPGEKKAAAAVYTENLLEHGGLATDMIKAAIGEEKTAVLLREVLFGTGTPE